MAESTPPDPELDVYTAIFDLLEAYEPFADMVEPGNRIRLDKTSGDEDPMNRPTLADSDADQALLEFGDGSTDLYTSDESFATHSEEGPCNWLESFEVSYNLKLTSRVVSETESSTLGRHARNAIRKGGPKLGLDFVTRVRLRWKSVRRRDSDTGDVFRIVTDMTIMVSLQVDGITLRGV